MTEAQTVLTEIYKRHRRGDGEDLSTELCDWCEDRYFPCRDRVAAAAALGIGVVDGTPPDAAKPAGYVVARDSGDHLEIIQFGSFATEEEARADAEAEGEGWAVYAAYPVRGGDRG